MFRDTFNEDGSEMHQWMATFRNGGRCTYWVCSRAMWAKPKTTSLRRSRSATTNGVPIFAAAVAGLRLGGHRFCTYAFTDWIRCCSRISPSAVNLRVAAPTIVVCTLFSTQLPRESERWAVHCSPLLAGGIVWRRVWRQPPCTAGTAVVDNYAGVAQASPHCWCRCVRFNPTFFLATL